MAIRYADLPATLRETGVARPALDLARTWGAMVLVALGCGAWPGAGTWLVGAILLGTLQYHLNILAHDGVHGNLSRNRPLNEFVTRWLLLGPQGIPLGVLRANHLRHHAQLGEPADDDRQYYDLTRHASRARWALWLAGSFVGGMVLPLFWKMLQRRSGSSGAPAATAATADLASVVVTQLLIALALWALTGVWWAWLPLWGIPLVTVMTGLNTARSCLEHADVPRAATPFRQYSFVSHSLERFFLAPLNMNHHWEHHRYMRVPYHRLPALRRHLRAAGDYADVRLEPSYWARFRTLWRDF